MCSSPRGCASVRQTASPSKIPACWPATAYITDSDWHGIYDRSLAAVRHQSDVVLEENVWIGDSAIVCKGVTIGKNSIVGAGSVVTSDIPANVIAAGNPAKIIRALDPDKPVITRKDRYQDTASMTRFLEASEKQSLGGNTFRGWIRSLIFPGCNPGFF
jgi:hypothetical protein